MLTPSDNCVLLINFNVYKSDKNINSHKQGIKKIMYNMICYLLIFQPRIKIRKSHIFTKLLEEYFNKNPTG